MRNERARDTGNRTYLARRCRPVLLAQLYYAGRELLFCCGVLTAFLVFSLPRRAGAHYPVPREQRD